MAAGSVWHALSSLAEPATVNALLTVVVVDLYSVYRAHEAALRLHGGSGDARASSLQEQFVRENVHALEGDSAYWVPVVLTTTLLALFFFARSIGAVLTALTAVSAVLAGVYFLWPAGELFARALRKSGLVARGDGGGFVELALTLPPALGVVLVWLFSGHWVANNLIGVFTCVMFASLCRVNSMRIATILFAGLFVYDVFFVFFSKRFFGKNVMLEVATASPHNPAAAVASWLSLPFKPVANLALPAKLIFPDGVGSFSILGLGDIMLPMLLLVYLLGADLVFNLPLKSGLYARGMAAHCIGLVGSFFCNVMFDSAQPALFYIVPVMLAATLISARNWGVAPALWDGSLTRSGYSGLERESLVGQSFDEVQEKDLIAERL